MVSAVNCYIAQRFIYRLSICIGIVPKLNRRGIVGFLARVGFCNRRVYFLYVLTARIGTGKGRLRRAVIISPFPLGVAVGVSVGENVVDALSTEII